MPPRRPGPTILVQAGIAVAAMLALPMWPPASGRLLLVPITGGDANDMARIAIEGGAALMGAGPLPGSLVVVGDRAAVVAHIPHIAAIVMAAPVTACGASIAAERFP
jgi:hypothetical protein